MAVVVVIALVGIDIDHDNCDKTAVIFSGLLLPLKHQFAVEVPTVEEACQSVPESEAVQFPSLVRVALLLDLAFRNVARRSRQRVRLSEKRVNDRANVRFHPKDSTIPLLEEAGLGS